MAVHKKELSDKIIDWLQNQGYPLEMMVALSMKKAGFSVKIADVYEDYETHQQREIDITAVQYSSPNNPSLLQVGCRIECKHSRKNPWIIFVSQAQPEHFLPLELLCSSASRIFLIELFKKAEIRERLSKSLFWMNGYLGHGLTQAFKKQEDMANAAIYSCIKSSIDLVSQFDKDEMILSAPKINLCSIIFPVIVIDSQLFECFITEKEEILLNEVKVSSLIWRGKNPINSTAIIRIVTKPYLETFVNEISNITTELIKVAEENISELDSATELILKKTVQRKYGNITNIG
jgi:hypothetical protein